MSSVFLCYLLRKVVQKQENRMAEDLTITIRWKLRIIMAQRNIRNNELAEATGLSLATISRLRRTDTLKQITSQVLVALCYALKCSFDDLMEFSPDDNSPPKKSLCKVPKVKSSKKEKEIDSANL